MFKSEATHALVAGAARDGHLNRPCLSETGTNGVRQDAGRFAEAPRLRLYSMPSNSTSNTSVLFGGIFGLGLMSP